MKVTLIVTTYNWPEALEISLRTALRQSHDNYEIIVADDGSNDSTFDVVERIKNETRCCVSHVWQKDKGFRAAAIRNRAIAKATGDYVIFVDGDCLLPYSFVSDHLSLAEEAFFVAGSRIKFIPSFTRWMLSNPEKIPAITRYSLFKLWFIRKVKRVHPLLKLPLGKLRYGRKDRWQGAVTCNMAVWKKDLLAVNGFDNEFVGWGLEDSELVARLLNYGVKRKEGKVYNFVAHLYHEERSRDAESINRAKFEKSLFGSRVIASSGIEEIDEID
ncbi:MAG: glycosyltransferase [Pseudomonadota bacterium]